MLTTKQIAQYYDQGFLILENFAHRDECHMLREQAAILVSKSSVDPRCGFDSKSESKKFVSHSYFVESLNSVSLFFEASTITSEGKILIDKHEAIVKIGHALHDFDPVFANYSHSARMHEIAHTLKYQKPLIGQSRYFFKPSKFKIIFSPHQDSTMLYTEPSSCYALWLALADVNLHNGCMQVIPGSHRDGTASRYIKRDNNGKGSIKNLLKPSLFERWSSSSFIPLEVHEGSAILMNGNLVHKSGHNRSNSPRQAYAVHFIEGHESHKYPSDNWLQRPGGFGELRSL